jgi:hypothetical protein
MPKRKRPLGEYPSIEERVLVSPKPGTPGFQGSYTPPPPYPAPTPRAPSQPTPDSSEYPSPKEGLTRPDPRSPDYQGTYSPPAQYL